MLMEAVPAGASEAGHAYRKVVDEVCGFAWSRLPAASLTDVAWAYYYFSIQFRENLESARRLYPGDPQLAELDRGERDTDNLSPWPGVAMPGERLDHDEFMRRLLELEPVGSGRRRRLTAIGSAYLERVRAHDDETKALSIVSYEDGGLEAVFRSFLAAPDWDGPLLQAFHHFLEAHVAFDSDPDAGHGALCRHLVPDDRILPLWEAFRDSLIAACPALVRVAEPVA